MGHDIFPEWDMFLQDHPEIRDEIFRAGAERSAENWIEVDGERMTMSAYYEHTRNMGDLKAHAAEIMERWNKARRR